MALGPQAGLSVEVVCDHLSSGGPVVTHVRGTMIASSIGILKESGYHDRYVELLRPDCRDSVLYALASSWLPLDVALAHYQACDELQLGTAALTDIGERIAARYADTFLGTVLRTSRSAGIDAPWIALRSQPRIWDRLYIGGALKILRAGPKDAVGEFYGLPLARFRYFRTAYKGYYQGLAKMVVKNAYVHLARPQVPHPDTLALSASWV